MHQAVALQSSATKMLFHGMQHAAWVQFHSCWAHTLYMQAMIEQLMQEWKVADFSVAESIFKSRQRQRKQKGGVQLRQKMQV